MAGGEGRGLRNSIPLLPVLRLDEGGAVRRRAGRGDEARALRCLDNDEYESPEKDLRHIELLRTTGQLDAAREMCARFDSRGNDNLEYFLSRIKEMLDAGKTELA